MPSDVTGRVGFFDRFATRASQFASRAWFFAGCVAVVVIWAPTYLVIGSIDTWQLLINTLTTIVTFLMVALLQNSQTRANQAVQDKLNAIAGGLAELMTATADKAQSPRRGRRTPPSGRPGGPGEILTERGRQSHQHVQLRPKLQPSDALRMIQRC